MLIEIVLLVLGRETLSRDEARPQKMDNVTSAVEPGVDVRPMLTTALRQCRVTADRDAGMKGRLSYLNEPDGQSGGWDRKSDGEREKSRWTDAI